VHRPKLLYNKQIDSYLHRFGLYQMAIMGDYQLDKITVDNACREVKTGDVDVLSTSRRDDGDVGGCVVHMGLPIRGILLFLYSIFELY
jgi:hypothetical protein